MSVILLNSSVRLNNNDNFVLFYTKYSINYAGHPVLGRMTCTNNVYVYVSVFI